MRSLAASSLFALGALAANTTYDYIVVGGGTAGIIVAERLAETQKSVLLLERGGPSAYTSGNNATVSWNNTITPFDVPAYGYSIRSTTDSSTFCTDTASNAGCVLGGGGSVNAEIFVRPQEADFATWPEGWRWEDGVGEAAAALYERNPGTNNPSADGRRYGYDVYDILGGFLGENGWKEVDAIEQPNEKHDVYAYPPWNIQDSLRAGPVKTYLPLAQSLPNFTLRLHTKVVRVIRSGATATGVEIEDASGARSVISLSPSGAVVLAAGALSSPRVLFNSGIGPSSQLAIVANGTTGVTLPPRADWIDLPVGEGVRDHPIFYINLNLTSPTANLTVYDPLEPSATDISLFNGAGSGMLAQGVQRLNFWTSRAYNESRRFFQGTVSADSDNVISLKIYMTHGLTSEGALGITADGKTNFTTQPWLRTPEDKEAAVTFLDEMMTSLRTSDQWTLADWMTGDELTDATALLDTYTAGAHFVRTARIGSVVDADTKVIGTENVYVVDASIHYDVPTGNTNAMVMVVAEHAARKIVAAGGVTAKDC
ncbi:putative gmc oxidoreductase protein [Neofusicoccum parvum]|nr:putative gmc oxidoreductase protein [Neofusicoccum parvum]